MHGAASAWAEVLGRELTAKPSRRHVFAMLPEQPAIYIWKRNLRIPSSVRRSPRGLFEWVTAEVNRPYGLIANIQVSHFASLSAFQLGGGGLTDDKVRTLERLCATPLGQKILVRLFEGMNEATPALYVGEAEVLPVRIWEHLEGQSDFGTRLVADLELDWDQLVLRYLVLPPASDETRRAAAKEMRTLMEYVATKMTLGTSVSRIG